MMPSSDVPLTTAYSVNYLGLLSATFFLLSAFFSCLLLTFYFDLTH